MRLLWLFLSLTAILLVPFLIWGASFEVWLGPESGEAWFARFGRWAWLPALGLLLGDLLLPIPATAVIASLGYLYGPLLGGFIGSFGVIGSGLIAYGLCRSLGERAAIRLLGARDYKRGQRFFGKTGAWLIALSRWMPLLPEVVACMAGLSRMPFYRFFSAVCCGSVPLGFVYAAIGARGLESPGLALVVSLVLPPILWVLLQPIIARLGRGSGIDD